MPAVSEAALIERTERILDLATAEGTPLTDAIAATAKALAALIVATSQTDGMSFDELLKTTLTSVAGFAMDSREASSEDGIVMAPTHQ
jgi:hypothetical protein